MFTNTSWQMLGNAFFLFRSQAGRIDQVEYERHSRACLVDVLTTRSAAARGSECYLLFGNGYPLSYSNHTIIYHIHKGCEDYL